MNERKLLKKLYRLVFDTDPQTPERRMAVEAYVFIRSRLLGIRKAPGGKNRVLIRTPRPDQDEEPAKITTKAQCAAKLDEIMEAPE